MASRFAFGRYFGVLVVVRMYLKRSALASRASARRSSHFMISIVKGV
jgi:hypothetical protein